MDLLVVWHRFEPPVAQGPDLGQVARVVEARMLAAGASIAHASATDVVATVDANELAEVVDLELELLAELGSADDERNTLRVALALGAAEPTESADAVHERARSLVGRASDGELVLDATAHQVASPTFLFAKRIGGAAPAPRGFCLDRRYPRRESCRKELATLGAPIAAACPSLASAVEEIRLTVKAGARRVALRAPYGSGVRSVVDSLEAALQPAHVLHFGPAPGALEPLGSLRLLASRRAADGESLAETLTTAGIDPAELAKVVAVLEGRGVTRVEAADAVTAAVECLSRSGDVWFVIDPVSMVDPATVEVLVEAQMRTKKHSVLFARIAADAALPAALTRGAEVAVVNIPSLTPAEAAEIAGAMLGGATRPDIVQRAAVLGGGLPLGVAEAVRLLVASGDLVRQDDRFGWRTTEKTVLSAAAPEELLRERVHTLDATCHRALEVAVVAPEGSTPQFMCKVAELEGLREREFLDALRKLAREALFHPRSSTRVGNVLRTTVLRAMPPVRAAELHHLVAQVLTSELANAEAEYARATLGYYLGEGGQPKAGAEAVLLAARAAAAAGFVRSAMRLASSAVRLDPSDETRTRAAAITQTATSHPPPPGMPPLQAVDTSVRVVIDLERPPESVDRAAEALRAGDFAAAGRAIGTVDGDGSGKSQHRQRAIAHLSKGDVRAALAALSHARDQGRTDPHESAKVSLALGIALLRSGDALAALRATLGSLASTRQVHDARGEHAALRTLAACMRALGRGADAARLEHLAFAQRERG